MSREARKATCATIDLCEGGSLSWETVARECLSYMSEADVEDMATTAEWITEGEELEDAEPTEPEKGDYVVDGLTVFEVGGKHGGAVGSYKTWGELATALKDRMEDENWWPNVWLQDDHGGYTLTTL